jgi:adenylate kinase
VRPSARIVVLGKQGAGKGTQCVRLSHRYVVPHIATGDMLRAAVKLRTPLGRQAQTYMEAGELVPDELLLEMISERFDQDDTRHRGFILDGFPRTAVQAEKLDEMMAPITLDAVVYLDVPTDIVLGRLAARRVCVDCGTIYSVTASPRVDAICDVCGGEVIHRDDDTEAAIRRRLALYEALGKLVAVFGDGDPDDVTERLVLAIDPMLEPGPEEVLA